MTVKFKDVIVYDVLDGTQTDGLVLTTDSTQTSGVSWKAAGAGFTKMPDIAAVTVPFADLTAAANAYNSLLAELKTAGLMATS